MISGTATPKSKTVTPKKAKAAAGGARIDGLPARRPVQEPVEPMDLDVRRIDPSPYQPRQAFPDHEIAELAATIAEYGQITPISVRRKGDRYELLDGERRTRAVEKLGWPSIRAEVQECSDAQARAIVVVSAIQRKALNAIEEARGFRTMLDAGDAPGPTELARQLGLSQGHVSNRLRLLELPADWQRRVISGEIAPTQARDLVPLAAHGKILDSLAKDLKQCKEPPEGDDWKNLVWGAVIDATADPGKTDYDYGIHRTIPAMTLSETQQQELGLIEVKNPWSERPEKRVTNTKRFQELWASHVAAVRAKAEKKAAGKVDAQDGGKAAGKVNGQPAKRLTPAQIEAQEKAEAERKAELLCQYARRLWDWYVRWLRYLIAAALRDDSQTDRPDLEKLLLYLAVDLRATTGSYVTDQRGEILQDVLRDQKLPIKAGKRLSGILELDNEDDLLPTLAFFLADCFFSVKEGEFGTGIPIPAADVETIAGYLAVNPVRSWEREQAGPHLSEAYWALHTKDQLCELIDELKIDAGGAPARLSKDELIKACWKPGLVTRFPKELAKVKRPK